MTSPESDEDERRSAASAEGNFPPGRIAAASTVETCDDDKNDDDDGDEDDGNNDDENDGNDDVLLRRRRIAHTERLRLERTLAALTLQRDSAVSTAEEALSVLRRSRVRNREYAREGAVLRVEAERLEIERGWLEGRREGMEVRRERLGRRDGKARAALSELRGRLEGLTRERDELKDELSREATLAFRNDGAGEGCIPSVSEDWIASARSHLSLFVNLASLSLTDGGDTATAMPNKPRTGCPQPETIEILDL